MSTLNITDLLRELQAGEEARAQIPQLQNAHLELARKLDEAQEHSQALELAIGGYKSTISDLTTKVARLEVERDDAGFRELETQDKLNTLLSDVRGLRAHLGDAIDHIDPPKPEPVPQPVVQDAAMPVTEPKPNATPVPITDHGAERAADPMNPTANAPATATNLSEPVTGSPASTETNATTLKGQSDPRPTAPSTEATPSSASGDAALPSAPAHSMTDQAQAYRPFGGAADGDKPKHTDTGDYPAAKRWYNKPNDMSLEDWKASGGQP